VGPEGGWTEEELASAELLMGLGDGVLRAETAAIVVGTLVCALRDRGFSQ
jgi:16S rRNA U1498 N3-methylase RsmE